MHRTHRRLRDVCTTLQVELSGTEKSFDRRAFLKTTVYSGLATAPVFLMHPAPGEIRDEKRKPNLDEVRLQKLSASMLSLDLGAGSNLAVTALSNLHVVVWDLQSGGVLHEFAFPEPATDSRQKLENDVEPVRVRFAPNGKTLGISFLSRIHLYSVASWEETLCLKVDDEDAIRPRPKPELARRSPSEKGGASVSGPNLNQHMRDWARTKMQGDGRTRVTDFRFTSDGLYILAAYCSGGCYDQKGALRIGAFPSGNDPVRLWEVKTTDLVWERTLDASFEVERVAISPDDARFVAAEHRPGHCRIDICDLKSGRLVNPLPEVGFAYAVPGLLFTPDGNHLITLRAEEATQKERPWDHLAMYDADSGKLRAGFSGHYPARHADLSPDGRWLATSWNGIRFQIWDMRTRKVVATKAPREWRWSGPPIETVRFSPDSRWFVAASDTAGALAVYRLGE